MVERDIAGNGIINGIAVCQTVVLWVPQVPAALEVRLEHKFQSRGLQQSFLQDTEVDLEELGDICVYAATSNVVDDGLGLPEISDFVESLTVISFPQLHLSCLEVRSFVEVEGDIAGSNWFKHVLTHAFA